MQQRSGDNMTDLTDPGCPSSLRVRAKSHVGVFQNSTVPSADANATTLWSGNKMNEMTLLVWPMRLLWLGLMSLIIAFHICTVPSADAEAMRLPSEEYTTDVTVSECPARKASKSPVAAFNIRTVPSADAEARCRLFGENAIEVMTLGWLCNDGL